jgi:EpsI family protein
MKGQTRYLIIYLLLGLTAVFLSTHETVAVPVNKPLNDIPIQLDSWKMTKQSRFSADTLEALKPTDYLHRVYKDAAGNRVTLYLGYHAGGPESGPIHSPKHCLPGGGWFELSEETLKVTVAGNELPLVQAVYQHGDQKEMFIYYYQVKGKTLTDEYSLKFAEITNSILYNRRDSAFIRISIPFHGDQSVAASVGESFVREIYPYIVATLPL